VQVLPYTPGDRRHPGHNITLTPPTIHRIRGLAHVTSVDTMRQTPPLRVTVGGRSVDLAASGQSPVASGYTLVANSAARAAGPDTVLVPQSTLTALHLTVAALVGQQVTLTVGGDVAAAGKGESSSVFVVGPARHISARAGGVFDDSASHAELVVDSALAARINGQLSGMSAAAYLNRRGYQSLMVHADDARQTQPVANRIAAMNDTTRDRADSLARVQTA